MTVKWGEWFGGLGRIAPVFGITCLVGVGVADLSVMLVEYVSGVKGPFHFWQMLGASSFWLGAVSGVSLWCIVLGIQRHGIKHGLTPVKDVLRLRHHRVALVAAFLAVLVVPSLVVLLVPAAEAARKSWEHVLLVDPGGGFAIVVGLFTIFGLVLTLKSVTDARRSISSFGELVDRLCELADGASDADPLRILAYTPAIAFLAQPPDDWKRLHDALLRSRSNSTKPSVRIVCLRADDLAVWHGLFAGRTTLRAQKLTTADTDAASKASEQVLGELSANSEGRAFDDAIKRLPWSFMPGFYVFVRRSRAIIVSPQFLPLPIGVARGQEGLPTPSMLGIDTHDRAVVATAEQIIGFYAELPEHFLAETTGEVSTDAMAAEENREASTVAANLAEQLVSACRKSLNKVPYAGGDWKRIRLELRAHPKRW